MARRRIICACCGQEGSYGGWGWRSTCYSRWHKAGCPEDGPPPPATPEVAQMRAAAMIGRRTQDVRKRQRKARAIKLYRYGGKPDQIARRLGVTERTILRYLAEARVAGELLAPGSASGDRAQPRAHQGGSMKQTYQHDPDWLINRLRSAGRQAPAVGSDSFDAKLGPVPYWHLTDEEIHDVRIRTLGLRLTGGETDPAALRETLDALGVGAVPDRWIADEPAVRAA